MKIRDKIEESTGRFKTTTWKIMKETTTTTSDSWSFDRKFHARWPDESFRNRVVLNGNANNSVDDKRSSTETACEKHKDRATTQNNRQNTTTRALTTAN